MPKRKLKYLLLLVILMLPLSAAAVDPPMDPAPADWPRFEYRRQPGEFKRNKYGVIDPSPDVVSLEHLPMDKYGFVDWAQAMRDGIISPKDALEGSKARLKAEDTEVFEGDILIRSKLAFMPDVIFPHAPHTVWLKCSTCHPKIFRKKAGGNQITMNAIWKGQFCGRCHDRVAFPIRNCFKCHSVPREAKK